MQDTDGLAMLAQHAWLSGSAWRQSPNAIRRYWLRRTDLLECIAAGRTKRNELASLLPWNWKVAKAAKPPNSA